MDFDTSTGFSEEAMKQLGIYKFEKLNWRTKEDEDEYRNLVFSNSNIGRRKIIDEAFEISGTIFYSIRTQKRKPAWAIELLKHPNLKEEENEYINDPMTPEEGMVGIVVSCLSLIFNTVTLLSQTQYSIRESLGRVIGKTVFKSIKDASIQSIYGMALAETVIAHCTFIEREVVYVGANNSKTVFKFTDDVNQSIESYLMSQIPTSVYPLPMTTKPNDWEVVTGEDGQRRVVGGYKGIALDLIKIRYNGSSAELDMDKCGELLKAINILQNIPYKINKLMYRRGVASLGDSPKKDDYFKEYLDEETGELAKVFLSEKYESDKGKYTRKKLILHYVGKYVNSDKFYQVYQIDYRGRVYTASSMISTISDDFGKSLIEFADGYKLTDRGLFWAFATIGSLGGDDKSRSEVRYETGKRMYKEYHDSLLPTRQYSTFLLSKYESFQSIVIQYNEHLFVLDNLKKDNKIKIESTKEKVRIQSNYKNDLVEQRKYYKDILNDLKATVKSLKGSKVDIDSELLRSVRDRKLEEYRKDIHEIQSKYNDTNESVKSSTNIKLRLEDVVKGFREIGKKLNSDISIVKANKKSIKVERDVVSNKLATLLPAMKSLQNTIDEPWQFEALCESVIAHERGEQVYASAPFDASTSGWQLLSIICHSKQGMLKTNLLDASKRYDLYIEVSKASKVCVEDTYPGTDNEKYLDDSVSLLDDHGRSLAKTPTMTRVYSATKRNSKKKTSSKVVEIKDDNLTIQEKEYFNSLGYELGGVIHDTVNTVVPGASAYQKAVTTAVKKKFKNDGLPLSWKTEDGLIVHNRKYQQVTRTSKVPILGSKNMEVKRKYPKLDEDGSPIISPSKMANGASPNTIHTSDAYLLRQIVIATVKAEITRIITIHDSFACCLNDCDLFNKVIREVLVRISTSGELQKMLTDAGIEVPVIDEMLKEDFENILENEFCFM